MIWRINWVCLMSKYVCTSVVNNVCVAWDKLDERQVLDGLFALSYDDAWKIGMATALLFSVAWVFNQIYAFTKRT